MIYQPTSIAFYEGAVRPFRDRPTNLNYITKAAPLVIKFSTKS